MQIDAKKKLNKMHLFLHCFVYITVKNIWTRQLKSEILLAMIIFIFIDIGMQFIFSGIKLNEFPIWARRCKINLKIYLPTFFFNNFTCPKLNYDAFSPEYNNVSRKKLNIISS